MRTSIRSARSVAAGSPSESLPDAPAGSHPGSRPGPRRRLGVRLGLLAGVAATAAGGLLLLPMVGTASAATTTDPVKVGLYGSQDPTYDGVYRQSLALLAIEASGGTPAPAAVTWLLDQQCADGSFEAFRSDLATACTAPSSVSFSGPDTNSTGLAVQALVSVGKTTAATSALTWLAAHQSTDGGWAYYPDGAAGNDPDANSTAIVVSAFRAGGLALPSVGGLTGDDWLVGNQLGCSAAASDQGAFSLGGAANDFASVQGTLAVAGGFLPVASAAPIPTDEPTMVCPAAGTLTAPEAAADAAGYLARRLAANGGVIPDPFTAGQADLGSTANAVIALAATKHGGTQVAEAIAALGSGQASFTTKAGADVPGSLALLTMADVASGGDPSSFAGTDLVSRLAATITTAAATPTPTPTPTATSTPTTAPTPAPSTEASSGGAVLPDTGSPQGTTGLAALGAALLVAGGGLLLLTRGLARRSSRA